MYDFNFAPQGWQCPICKRVYSPTYPWCIFCGNESVTTTTTTTIPIQNNPSDYSNINDLMSEFMKKNREQDSFKYKADTSTAYKCKPNETITGRM